MGKKYLRFNLKILVIPTDRQCGRSADYFDRSRSREIRSIDTSLDALGEPDHGYFCISRPSHRTSHR